MEHPEIVVRIANSEDGRYAEIITEEMAASAKARGTGIARRSPEYIRQKMEEGKAVIALTPGGEWVGFCYIEAWSHGKFVANSGLVVSPAFRGSGVATRIKQEVFGLSRLKYPDAKIFGLTTGLAVMKINSELGYKPVTYSELTDDEEFWKGCQSCVNYDILMSKERKNCFCTGMLYDPAWENGKAQEPGGATKEAEAALNETALSETAFTQPATSGSSTADGPTGATPSQAGPRIGTPRKKRMKEFRNHFKLYERWIRFKSHALLKEFRKEENGGGGGGIGARKKFFTFFNLF